MATNLMFQPGDSALLLNFFNEHLVPVLRWLQYSGIARQPELWLVRDLIHNLPREIPLAHKNQFRDPSTQQPRNESIFDAAGCLDWNVICGYNSIILSFITVDDAYLNSKQLTTNCAPTIQGNIDRWMLALTHCEKIKSLAELFREGLRMTGLEEFVSPWAK